MDGRVDVKNVVMMYNKDFRIGRNSCGKTLEETTSEFEQNLDIDFVLIEQG